VDKSSALKECPNHVYIVKQGQFQVQKNIYGPKISQTDFENDLLKKTTTTTMRFNNNFKKVMGVKKGEVMRLLHAGVGRMLCDYDVIMDNVNQTSIICHSVVGQMFVLKKDDFKKLQTISDESFAHLKDQSKKE